MAHITKVNGTAYEILGGSTKVNGTDYDIIKGKTKVGGTDYDIEFDSGEWVWPGWDNANWEDVYKLCLAVKNGEISQFPSDIVVGAMKTVDWYPTEDNTTYGFTSKQYNLPAYIVRIDNTNGQLAIFIDFQGKVVSKWTTGTSSGFNVTYGASHLHAFCWYLVGSKSVWGTGDNKFNLSYIVPTKRRYAYPTGSNTLSNYSIQTLNNEKFFVPCAREINIGDNGCDYQYPNLITAGLYSLTSFKSKIDMAFWTGSQGWAGTRTSKATYVISTSTASATTYYLTTTGKRICVMTVIGGS